MSAILPFIKDDPAFDPEDTQAMVVALGEVCELLKLPEGSDRERQVIAIRIVELARRGERNAERLRDRVIKEAGESHLIY